VNAQAIFDGGTPAGGSADLASLAAGETQSFTFNEQLGTIGQRGATESVDAYLSRLAAEDGRIITSQTTTRYSDVSGAFFSPILSVSASRLRLPILSMRISGIGCALPRNLRPYPLALTTRGQPASASRSVA